MGMVIKDLVLTILFTVLITGVCTVLLACLPRSLYTSYTLARPLPLAVLLVVAGLTLYESFCFTGALRVNRYVGKAAARVETLAAQAEALTGSDLVRIAVEEYPALKRCLAETDSAAALPRDCFERLSGRIRGYAWRRFAWLAGFLVVGGAVLARDASRQHRLTVGMRNIYMDI